jgi:pimeloyl-ACP methyl ester carboxylesterase
MTAETHPYVKRGFVHSPHGNIEYRESGDGPPILFIHGTPQSSVQMVGAFRHLQDGHRCVAMSTMGYGDSDRPPEPYTTMHEYAQAVIWVLDELSIEKAVVMGTHTGAGVALCVAADWPERVSAAILEEPFNWSSPARLRAMASVHTPIPERADGGHLVEIWNRVRGAGARTDPDEIRRAMIDHLTVDAIESPAVYEGMGWHGAAAWAMCQFDAWEAAARIQAPTLVIHGASSNLGRSHDRFLEVIPNALGLRPPAPNQWSWHIDLPMWSREVGEFLRGAGVG